MADIDLVIERLRRLKDLGIAIAIDDFGTGYSSLSYLRKLPIDILKIDKSFVDAATAGEPGADAILHAILNLSSGLHLRTLAEGIERSDQAQHLRELGCQSAQGFFFARPMVPSDVEFLISSTSLAAASH
jgi:sensor c-di-GMP phosphodiesterase-like protein